MSIERLLGRWDLTVGEGSKEHPAWLELTSTPGGVQGRYVGVWGSARPVAAISVEGGRLKFSLPSQYEGYPDGLTFEGELKDDVLRGVATVWEPEVAWRAKRAPVFGPPRQTTYGVPVDLIARGLEGWHARTPEAENNWSHKPEGLVNSAVGTDIVSNEVYDDFRLEAEYSYPEDSNSGIYLRGRYEFQIVDDYGKHPTVGSSGAIYGFIVPSAHAVNAACERNTAVIELVGRTISVTLNGQRIVDAREIPGITGGALDSHEGEPGPVLLQGDHGPVTFHRLVLTPLV